MQVSSIINGVIFSAVTAGGVAVDRVFGGKTADQCTGLELRLRAILDRASGRAFLPRHACYNDLADELEKLARDASAFK